MTNYNHLSKKIIGYRRDLHQIPELGYELPETTAYVRKILSGLSCSVDSIVGSGIIAYFDFGKDESIAFRGDMDALPITEENNLPYASKHKGCMHACGHDFHTAGLLGFAEILDNMKKEGFAPNYNAVLLFQPAEEIIEGAHDICQTSFFKDYNISAIFGIHNWPSLPKGQISSVAGPMMARSTSVDVTFDGLSAHCGEPHKGHDALFAACKFITDLYKFKEDEIKEYSVIKFGKLESGNVRNAISPRTVALGTMRTFQDETYKAITEKMDSLAESIGRQLEVQINVDYSKYHPAVVNDSHLYNKVIPMLKELNYKELDEPVMIAEDFSFYQQQVPGVFFFLGTGSDTPLHSKNFNMDDSLIVEGVKLFETIFKGM